MKTRARLLVLIVACAAGCKLMMNGGNGEEPVEVKIYGVGNMPDDPPDECKFIENVEVKNLEDKGPPLKKFETEARNRDGNAVAHIHKDGFKDGYLGKEYQFVGSIYECPVAKAPASGASASSAPAGASADASAAATAAGTSAATASAKAPAKGKAGGAPKK